MFVIGYAFVGYVLCGCVGILVTRGDFDFFTPQIVDTLH